MLSAQVKTSSSGDVQIVAAPGTGKFIRVFGWRLSSNGLTNLTWKSATTEKDGPYYANQFWSQAANADYGSMFDCNPNEALNINNSAAIAIGGSVTYAIIG